MRLGWGQVVTGVWLVAGCTGSDQMVPEPPVGLGPPPGVPFLEDVGNQGDARDARVSFEAQSAGTFSVYLAEPDAHDEGDVAFAEIEVDEAGLVHVGGVVDATDRLGGGVDEGRTYTAIVTQVAGADEIDAFTESPPVTFADEAIVRTLARIDAGTGGMEVGADGRIYMGDFGAFLSGTSPGEVVWRISPDGASEVFARGQFGASGNAFDGQGHLLQSSIAGGFVSRIAPDGTPTTVASGLSAPVGIAVHPDGTMYVANCGNGSVTATDPAGTTTQLASSTMLRCPNGIARLDDGDLVVANFSDGNLIRVTPLGDVSMFASLPGSNLGHLVHAEGRLYVAVRGAHQLVEVSLQGVVTPLAGTGSRGRADGPARQATLSFPNDLALSVDGTRLYFNDVAPSTSDPNEIRPTLVRELVFARDPS